MTCLYRLWIYFITEEEYKYKYLLAACICTSGTDHAKTALKKIHELFYKTTDEKTIREKLLETYKQLYGQK